MKKLLFIALTVIAIPSFAQSVVNKLNFQPGQKLEVYTQMNRNSVQEIMGQSMESSFSSMFTSTFDVNEVTETAINLESKVKRIKLDMSFFGRNENFDSDNKDDLKNDMGKQLSTTLNSKYGMTIDPTGAVTAIKLEDDKNKKAKGGNDAGMMGMLLSQLNLNTGAPKVGEATLFKILPDKEISKGESWTTQVTDEGGKKNTVYTLADVTEKEILIDYTEESALETKQQMMGREAGISIKSKTRGSIILDKATGILKQKTFITDSKENINAAGQVIPSSSKITTTIIVKPV